VRNQHAQRRCDHHRTGEGRHSHGANHFSSADCKNGQRQSCRARKRDCASCRRCECLTGRGEEAPAALGRKGAREIIEGCRVTPMARQFSLIIAKNTPARGMSVFRNHSFWSRSLASASLFYRPGRLIFPQLFGKSPSVGVPVPDVFIKR
jgi:hypothetical protein